jgi:type VI protein secretion system component Hcp
MPVNQNSGGNLLGRIVVGSAIMVLMVGAPLFLARTAQAAVDSFIRITGPDGAIDGGSKDPAHMNWITVSSVVAGDLNGDAAADREASAPSVSEVTAKPTAVAGSKSASDSWSSPTAKSAIGSQSSGAGAGKVTTAAPRDMATGMASGKRMHKPFTITKEIDRASPLLMKACASGQHFPQVDVQLASGEKYTLTDVMVASDQKSSGGEKPTETISFTYQKIEMTR